jgi:hypothetical protein
MSDLLLKDISGKAYGSSAERQAYADEHGLKLVQNKGEMQAYKDEENKRIYVAHRGTSKKKDISADIALFFGQERSHPRFKRARKMEADLEHQYPGYDFVVTGHSLGGTLAQASAGRKRVKSVTTFNKGSGIVDLLRPRSSKQTDYVNVYDPVSALSLRQKGGKQKRSRKIAKGKHMHSIESSYRGR